MFGRIGPLDLVLPGIVLPGGALALSGGSLAMMFIVAVTAVGLRAVL